MAKLITKFKYIKPGNGAGSYLKYIATREGVEKIDDSKKLLPTTAKQKILTEEDPQKKKSYLALPMLSRHVLEECIGVLGFEAPERM